ncbi:MAG: hypothetical protein WCK34_18440, partial [Bacteroidota bacterium]
MGQVKRFCLFFFVIGLVALTSCGSGRKRLNIDTSKITIPEIKVHRYDIDLFRIRQSQLQQGLEALKPEYRFFLGTDLGDPGKLA